MEVGGLTLNFLDLTIRLTEEGHTFCIYRKTTVTDSYVNGSSFYPWPHKLAAFNWLIHRLVSIPMCRQDFEQETSTLEYLAKVNHIHVDLKRMIQKKLLRVQLDNTTFFLRSPHHGERTRWIRLPFLGKFSSEIGHTLRPFGLKPAFYNLCTLRHVLPPTKDVIPDDAKSGVYSLECRDCSGIYIGETGRDLITRVSEHLPCWFSGSFGRSAFSDHLLISGHVYKAGSAKLITLRKVDEKTQSLRRDRNYSSSRHE